MKAGNGQNRMDSVTAQSQGVMASFHRKASFALPQPWSCCSTWTHLKLSTNWRLISNFLNAWNIPHNLAIPTTVCQVYEKKMLQDYKAPLTRSATCFKKNWAQGNSQACKCKQCGTSERSNNLYSEYVYNCMIHRHVHACIYAQVALTSTLTLTLTLTLYDLPLTSTLTLTLHYITLHDSVTQDSTVKYSTVQRPSMEMLQKQSQAALHRTNRILAPGTSLHVIYLSI